MLSIPIRMMLDSEIYVKTDAGRDEIKSRTLGLPMSIRAILLMVDGQRTVSSIRSIIAGSKAPADVLDSLVAQGLIEARAAPAAVPPLRPSIATPQAAAPWQQPATTQATGVTARAVEAPTMHAPRPVPSTDRPAPFAYDGPLDLTLPTIYGSDEAPAPPPPPGDATAPLAAAGVAPVDRYEHLYSMMNEVVRDFLAPHRRYFIQLKIERCGTPEELLELLHTLQTALAKARGDAFASEVIARLRSAAG